MGTMTAGLFWLLVMGLPLTATLIGFAVGEGVALTDRIPNNTLSRVIRPLMWRHRWVSLAVWLLVTVGFLVWFTDHIWFQHGGL